MMKVYNAIIFLAMSMITLSCGGMISDAQKDPVQGQTNGPTPPDGPTVYTIKGTYLNKWDTTTCTLSLTGPGVSIQKSCGSNGTFVFTDLLPGSYTLTATVSSGILSPDHYDCVITSADSVEQNFTFSRYFWSMTGTTANESLASIVEDADGYVAVGVSPATGKMKEIYCVKYNPNGDIVWQKWLGGADDDEGVKIKKASDDGYYLLCNSVSYTSSLAGLNGRLIRIDASGTVLWDTTFGGFSYDSVSDVLITSDGSAVICGSSKSFSASMDSDFYAVKINSSGSIVWSKTYGTAANEYAVAIAAVSDSAYILAGYTNGSGGTTSQILLKTIDGSGNETASQILSFAADESVTAIAPLGGNRFALASNVYNTTLAQSDAEIIIVDGSLAFESRTSYGSTGNSEFTSVCSDGAGGLYASGYLCKPTGWKDKDFYLVKIASDGTVVYAKTFGDGSEETSYSVATTSHGVILSGASVASGVSYLKVISCDVNGVIQ